MFLSLLTLLQTNLPCSVNYYRYKNNYEKVVGEEQKDDGPGANQTEDVVKSIASPRLMKKLSPVAKFVEDRGINVNPMASAGLLKYAFVKKREASEKVEDDDSASDGDD